MLWHSKVYATTYTLPILLFLCWVSLSASFQSVLSLSKPTTSQMSQSGPRRRRTLTFSNHSALQQLSLQQLLRLGNNQCQLLHFIALRGSQDQPSAHEFTNFIRLQPYCWNQRWHGHGCSHVRYCDSHCESRTGWCSYLQPELQAASRGWRGWAKRTLLSFPEVSHR